MKDQELIASELRYRRLFETAQDGILLIDFDTGMIMDVNKFLIDLLDYSKDEFLGKHLWEVGVFKDVSALKDNFKTLQSRRYVRFEDLPLETKSGNKIDVEFVANAYTVEDETVIQCNIREITARKVSERELQKEKILSDTIIESIPGTFYMLDEKGCYVRWNAFQRDEIIGKPERLVAGTSAVGTIHPEDRALVESKIKSVLTKGKDEIVEGRVLMRGGPTFVWFLMTGRRVILNGNPFLIGTGIDITSRKLGEQQISEIKNRDEAIINSTGDSVFATDTFGNILLFNKMSEEMTGITSKEAIGRSYKESANFIRESDEKPCNDFVSEAIKNNVVTKMANHIMLVRKDGRKIPVADSAAPIKDASGKVMGCVVVFHDVTKERQIDKAKTEFVSLASHQLRTPLSTINWYSEMLLTEDVGKLTPKQRQYSEEVHHASVRMVNLVNALLNVSRLELGTFSVEPEVVNIASIVQSCIKELKPFILKKKATLNQKVDDKVTSVKADPKMLTIIITNLLSNSIKYSTSILKVAGKLV